MKSFLLYTGWIAVALAQLAARGIGAHLKVNASSLTCGPLSCRFAKQKRLNEEIFSSPVFPDLLPAVLIILYSH